MLKLLRSGDTVGIEYVSYSESRKTGGKLKSITCRNPKPQQQSKSIASTAKAGPYKDDIIIMDLELVAGDQPTNEYRKVYPLFITKINNSEVQLGL